MGYARLKGEPWIFSTPSPAGRYTAGRAAQGIRYSGPSDRYPDRASARSSLPVVAEARKALGEDLNYESLESYIVGKLFLTILASH